ncbi:WD40 domain-containing protein [Limnoglobus roseus]|uniref:WD-40 repeat protein n=1 Tax=Limnoglobus roseus TaxID=2598579 RepID=A0A5C1A2S0_9BACT|nr:c-type cytochrome domain-containing protein [Limnoglobus roseus]QEL13419.1 WD-40 repeat protein [Limnoglobus roseus]
MLRSLALLLILPAIATAQAPKADAVTYKDHVQPILRKYCLNCHNADKSSSDLDVSTYAKLIAGGASGEAVKAGSPAQSLLYKVVNHEVEPKMPPKGGKMPDADLAVLKKWIEGGAPETAVGAAKAASRKVDLDPVALTQGKPTGPPPMPVNWASTTLAKTSRPHPVTAIAASPWAPLIAVAGHERVLLYNSDTLKLAGTLAFPERIPHVLKFSRDGKWLLAAGGRGASSGKVVIWGVTTGKRVTEIGDEADVVLAADVSPNHKLVALGGPGKLVKIFDTATGEMKHKIKKHTDWVTALEFSPDGTMLASGDRNGGAFVWEAETGGIVFTLGDHKDAVTDLNWRADSVMLASASEDGKVILWAAEDGFPARSITAQADSKATGAARNKPVGVLSVNYARNGNFLTCGRDNTARVWNPSGNQLAKFDGFPDVPTKVAFSHDGAKAFVGDFTGTVRVWKLPDNKPIGELTTNPD